MEEQNNQEQENTEAQNTQNQQETQEQHNVQENKSVQKAQETTENPKSCLKQECWKKCLAMTLAAFLGGFLAVYFVADRTYHHKESKKFRYFDNNRYNNYSRYNDYDDFRIFDNDFWFDDSFFMPNYARKQIKRMEKEQDRMLKNMAKTPWSASPLFHNPVKISAFYDDDNFKVVVDTKNFDDDDFEKNIQYKIDGRKFTVYGKSEVREKGYESDVSFSQDMILPENAKVGELKTYRENHKWVLTIPVEMN